jgi:hypothetical protein
LLFILLFYAQKQVGISNMYGIKAGHGTGLEQIEGTSGRLRQRGVYFLRSFYLDTKRTKKIEEEIADTRE